MIICPLADWHRIVLEEGAERCVNAEFELSDLLDLILALLDSNEHDCDLEDDEREADADDEMLRVHPEYAAAQLVEGIVSNDYERGEWFIGGTLPVYDRCTCCGHLELVQ